MAIALTTLSDVLKEKLNKAGVELVEQLQDDIKNKKVTKYGSVNASGNLAKSVNYKLTETNLTIYADDYIYYLENGRKPGKRPPRNVIRQWIDDKGLNPIGISKDSLAFLIQRKIGLKGTTIFEQGGSDLVSGIIDSDYFTKLVDDIAEEMSVTIASEIVKGLK